MPTTSKLTRLFSAVAEENLPRILQVATEIVQDEENKGHHRSAQLLKGALLKNGKKASALHDSPIEDCLFGVAPHPLMPAIHSAVKLEDIILQKNNKEILCQVMKEWHHRVALAQANIPRRSKLFFYGPPGCGKSMSARAIGNELSIPTFIIRYDSVIGAYLGQTASRLREIFHYAETTPCVLLIDEVDALGKQRGSLSDVGELDRIVISLMQELEHSSPKGFIIAASNMPDKMDEALWRRFDAVLSFPKPNKRDLASFTARLAIKRKIALSICVKEKIQKSSSFAEAERIVDAETRAKALKRFESQDDKKRFKC